MGEMAYFTSKSPPSSHSSHLNMQVAKEVLYGYYISIHQAAIAQDVCGDLMEGLVVGEMACVSFFAVLSEGRCHVKFEN